MADRELNQRTGDRLRKCIDASGMTQKELAEKSNYTEQHISKLVKGKSKLTTDTARALSKILDVRLEYLLLESEYMTDNERIYAICDNLSSRDKLAYKLLESLGYEIIDMKENSDGSQESMHRPFSRITINKSIDEYSRDDSPEEILEKAKNAIPIRIFILKSPSGKQKYIEQDEFQQIIKNILNFAKFQCENIFQQPCNHFMR